MLTKDVMRGFSKKVHNWFTVLKTFFRQRLSLYFNSTFLKIVKKMIVLLHHFEKKCYTNFCFGLNHFTKDGLMSQNRHPFRAYALMSAIVSQLVGSILAGIFLGRWLDKLAGTEPLFLIICLLMGLGTGVYAMLRLIRQFYSGDQ